jgi:hypothetical protein
MTGKISRVPAIPKPSGRASGEFAARGLKQIEIARVVNVVADGAFGVSDAVRVAKRFSHGRSVRAARQKFNARTQNPFAQTAFAVMLQTQI